MPSISTMLFLLWAVALVLAFWSLRVAQVFAQRMPRVAARPLDDYFPAVAVILPLKGVDDDTERNVRGLLRQAYPNYRLLFTVESAGDPVVKLLERIAASQPPGRVEVVIAGLATERGQKVHNQLAAVARTTEADEVLAFMDADAHPGPTWLRALVGPLGYGPHIGATTGYRFYVPQEPTAPASILSIVNAGVGALLGPYRRTFAWGGSMAIRRPDFFAYGLHAAWQGALSDDYVLSHVVRQQAGTKIHYVPQCMVASVAEPTWASLAEFAVRQYRITRVCQPLVWLAALCGPILYLFGCLYPWVGLVLTLTLPHRWPGTPWHFALMGVVFFGMSAGRGALLLLGAHRLLPRGWPRLRRAWAWYLFGGPVVQACNLAFLLASAVGRRITWRGVTYVMCSRTHTLVQRRTAPAEPLAAAQPVKC